MTTLAALYPGRIDLGIGRARGGDDLVRLALRLPHIDFATFERDLDELLDRLDSAPHGVPVQMTGESKPVVPVWLLGSSVRTAALAGRLGLPFSYAAHFAPELLKESLREYRSHFRPSAHLARPYTMIGLHIIVADSDESARRLFTSTQQGAANVLRGSPSFLPPPIEDIDKFWSTEEKAVIERRHLCSLVGSSAKVQEQLKSFIHETATDELIVTASIFDHDARLHSYELLAEIGDTLKA